MFKKITTVVLIAACCLCSVVSVGADEVPTETATEVFTEVPTDISTEAPSDSATEEIIETLTSTAPSVLYLKPNSNWSLSNARFAMRFTGDSEVWVSMIDLGNGYYKAYVPSGYYESFIFLRMDPSTEVNSWTTKWNYSQELTFPTDGLNCFTVTEKEWNDSTGTWSTYSETEQPTEEITDPIESVTDNPELEKISKTLDYQYSIILVVVCLLAFVLCSSLMK
ncbi:MAG: hypothetical protein UH241_10300 [Acutalibacteraceae bacterium]|nr:hypothetical protein [Acutalibacteraceae bacterium]